MFNYYRGWFQIFPLDGLPGQGVHITVTGHEFGTENDMVIFNNAIYPDNALKISGKLCMEAFADSFKEDDDDFNIRIRTG